MGLLTPWLVAFALVIFYVISVINILIWVGVGSVWWRVIGLM